MRRRGFTLLEVALAIALSSVLLYLLLSAVELYLVREDRNRVRVEATQVARAVLDMIADDLQQAPATPPSPPRSSGGGRGAGGGGPAGTAAGAAGGPAGPTGGGMEGGGAATPPAVSGGDASAATTTPAPLRVIGNAKELWIARTATPSWAAETAAAAQPQTADAQGAPLALLPMTVRYALQEGRAETTWERAARGVEDERTSAGSGLVREWLPTAAAEQLAQSSNLTSTGVGLGQDAQRQLLAPEVVELQFAFFDGTQWLDQWDASLQTTAPLAVEIRLKALTMSYEQTLDRETLARFREGRFAERDVANYRRVVFLPPAVTPSAQQALLPPAAQGGGGRGGAANGQGGGDPGDEQGPGGPGGGAGPGGGGAGGGGGPGGGDGGGGGGGRGGRGGGGGGGGRGN